MHFERKSNTCWIATKFMSSCCVSSWRRMVIAPSRKDQTKNENTVTGNDMGLWVWPRNKTIVVLVEEPIIFIFTHTKSKTRLLKSEQHVLLFFPDIHGVYALWICSPNTNCKTASAGTCVVKMTWKVEFRDWFLHLENIAAPSFSMLKFLAWKKTRVVTHPPNHHIQ